MFRRLLAAVAFAALVPAAALAQPMLQMSADPDYLQVAPVEAVVGEIRGFLDRV